MEATSFWSPPRANYIGETGSLLAHLGRSKNEPLQCIRSINELKAYQKIFIISLNLKR